MTANGFTFIETLMVVLLMGIVATLAVPAVDSVLTGEKIDAAAASVVGDIRYAQSLAIRTQKLHSVIFNPANDTYRLTDQAGTTVQHPLTKQAYQVSFVTQERWQGIDLVSTTFAGGTNTVTFDSLGAPQSAGVVTLGFAGKQRLISVVHPTGRVTYQ
jgi:type II secretion system protein H